MRPICRPSEGQRVVSNYRYCDHGLFFFKSGIVPNGMTVNHDGSWPGRKHDAIVLD